MSEMTLMENVADYVRMKRLHVLAVLMTGLAGVASAAPLNGTIGPIINEVVLLFGPITDLVVAAVPVLLVLAVIGFLLGIFDGVLSRIKI